MNIRRLEPRRLIGGIRRRMSRFARLTRAGRITLGVGSYGSPQVVTFEGDSRTKLHIGRYCSIASTSTFLLGGGHPMDRATMYPFRLRWQLEGAGHDGYPSSKGDIVVDDGAWIGHGALILSGVRIGRGAVVAAAAVVTKDVAPYSIVAGNPARLVRFRFGESSIAKIDALEWWTWSKPEILARLDEITSSIEPAP